MVPYLLYLGEKEGCLFKHPLERITRLELATSTLARWRSTRWAKSAYEWCLRSESNQRHGDFQSPALPTELQRRIKWRPGWGSNPRPLAWQASVLTNWTTRPHGGNNRARTCDPLLVRQMLSQLSYAPTWLPFFVTRIMIQHPHQKVNTFLKLFLIFFKIFLAP